MHFVTKNCEQCYDCLMKGEYPKAIIDRSKQNWRLKKCYLQKLPENIYEITMVGLSAEQKKKLPTGIKGVQRTQSVHELVQLYSHADVLINPTYEDNFPTVNIEALACGTPVITYNTGVSPEAIDEKNGVVIEQGDIDALVNSIHQMKKHPLSSEDCRKRAEKYFDKDKRFEKYIELYEGLI